MPANSLWVTLKIIFVFLTLLCGFWFYRKRKNSLSSIPSPFGLPLIGHVHLFLGSKGTNPLNTLMSLVKNYAEPGIFHIEIFNEKCVFIFKPEYLATFHKMNSIKKSVFYRPLDDVVNPSSFLADGKSKLWKKMRKMTVVNFFGTPLEIFYGNFLRASKRLVDDLKEKADGRPFTFHEHAIYASASIVCYNVGVEEVDEWKHYFTDVVPWGMRTAYERNFRPLHYFKPIFKLTPTGRKFYRVIEEGYSDLSRLYYKFKEQFSEMKKNGDPVPDLYVYNLHKNHPEEPKQLILSEFLTLFGAAADTTANTLGSIILALGLFPEIQEKILEEDREILSKLKNTKNTVEHLRQYKYLECVIKEGLRLFPGAPIIGRKLEEDTMFGDYVIPEGTNILAVQMHVNHDPEIFPEPFEFKPERFFMENLSKIPPYAYNPFSAGPRNCPGIQHAMISLKTLLLAILREFHVLSVYKNLQEAINNAEVGVILYDKNGYPIKLLPRLSTLQDECN